MKKRAIVLAVSLTAVISTGLTYGLTYNKYKREIEFGKKNADLLIAYDEIKNNFYKNIDDETLCEYMVKGVLDACNEDFCSFSTSNDLIQRHVNETSAVSRSGYSVHKNRHDEIVVTSVEPDSRADEMGLKANDVITMIDGETIAEKGGYYKAIRKLLGKDGTTVKLHIRRGEKEFDIDFTRANVIPESEKQFYTKILGNDILYIHFLSFDENTINNFEKALSGNTVSSMILDLRNNTGGEVHTAVELFDKFAGAGSQVTLKYVRENKDEVYTTTDGNEFEFEVTVLVNENTASSGEILSSLFKTTGRGKLIGETTYGKGIFQLKTTLSSMLYYSYTAGYVYVNDMPNYDEVGVEPDIEVTMDESKILTPDDIQLEKAIEILS